jgi:hypothetical protein
MLEAMGSIPSNRRIKGKREREREKRKKENNSLNVLVHFIPVAKFVR